MIGWEIDWGYVGFSSYCSSYLCLLWLQTTPQAQQAMCNNFDRSRFRTNPMTCLGCLEPLKPFGRLWGQPMAFIPAPAINLFWCVVVCVEVIQCIYGRISTLLGGDPLVLELLHNFSFLLFLFLFYVFWLVTGWLCCTKNMEKRKNSQLRTLVACG